jgi:hypothetical protein
MIRLAGKKGLVAMLQAVAGSFTQLAGFVIELV